MAKAKKKAAKHQTPPKKGERAAAISSLLEPDHWDLHDRLIGQLDTLVPFLALAHREVFDVLSEKYAGWYPGEQQDTLPDTYESYCSQVAHAAFCSVTPTLRRLSQI